MCGIYSCETEIKGERQGKTITTMNMVLRPGEALVWRWGYLTPLKYHGKLMTSPTYKDKFCNGLWEYRPDFTKELWRKGAAVEHIVAGPDGLAARKASPERLSGPSAVHTCSWAGGWRPRVRGRSSPSAWTARPSSPWRKGWTSFQSRRFAVLRI